MILLGLFGSVFLIMLFSTAFSRIANVQKPSSAAPMFAVTAMLAEFSADPEGRARIVGMLQRNDSDLDLAVYTESGELVATTMQKPFEPLRSRPTNWSSTTYLDLAADGKRKVEIIPVINSSGARFYALHGEVDKPTSPMLAFWFWFSCAIPRGWD